jgi:two-component system nitrogen regulation response regulator GlnG
VLSIDVPPLAARPEDIEPLARHFLARHVARRPQPAAIPALATDFLAALRDRSWPGNVRELKHAVEYAAVVARGGMLRPEHLPAPTAIASPPPATPLAAATAALTAATKEWAAAARHEFGDLAEPDLHHRASTAVEAALLREVLAHTGGNRTAAAKLLGLDRATLRTKLRILGLDE